ncbi:TRAP transporter large permease [Desulfovibrio aminophilus]|uniref:TRAP transporter large permease n=1 Tax=Desulfovibrio aminophilus TaxID=81425 RepID=UPI0003FEC22C|nr:TRAP transporter large permease [Desulfovibrio aminophilus]
MVAVGYIGLAIMVALLFMGVPVTFALGVVAVVGLSYVTSFAVVMQQAVLVVNQEGMSFIIICIPLFVFMGKMIYHTGIAKELFECIERWIGFLPGGLAMSATVTCAAFGAVTGSSVASVATMGTIIRPELKRYKYDDELSAGALTSAGTLAVLIPPSLGFIMYGVLTDTSIGGLFLAGVVPGILLTMLYCVYIFIRCSLNPKLGPRGASYAMLERIRSLKGTWGLLIIFVIIIGGIYGGFFTPTEASGVGVAGVLLICLSRRRLTWKAMRDAMIDTGLVAAMIWGIIVSGYLLARFLAVTGASQALVAFVADMGLSKVGFLIIISIIYLVLGMLLDMFGMLILTIPFFYPLVQHYGIDPIWFGTYAVIMCEIGLLTPPVGVNVFVMHDMAPDIPLKTIFRGIMPFAALNLFCVFLLEVFPKLATWLPYKIL